MVGRDEVLEEALKTLRLARKTAKNNGDPSHLLSTGALLIDLYERMDDEAPRPPIGFRRDTDD